MKETKYTRMIVQRLFRCCSVSDGVLGEPSVRCEGEGERDTTREMDTVPTPTTPAPHDRPTARMLFGSLPSTLIPLHDISQVSHPTRLQTKESLNYIPALYPPSQSLTPPISVIVLLPACPTTLISPEFFKAVITSFKLAVSILTLAFSCSFAVRAEYLEARGRDSRAVRTAVVRSPASLRPWREVVVLRRSRSRRPVRGSVWRGKE
jgi:hypothetical protein